MKVLLILKKIVLTVLITIIDIIPVMIFGNHNGRIGNAKLDLHSVWRRK